MTIKFTLNTIATNLNYSCLKNWIKFGYGETKIIIINFNYKHK